MMNTVIPPETPASAHRIQPVRASATPARSMPRTGGARIWLAALFVIVLSVGACSASSSPSASTSRSGVPTVAVPAGAAELEQTVQTVISRVQPSVVEVQSSGSQGQGVGSGEVIDAGGYIVTNDHVVRGFSQFQVVMANGQTLQASLVGEAPGDDLAVLKVRATNLQPINIGDSSAVQVGTFVLAIGSPLGLQQSATFGIVSAVNRTASEAPDGPAGTLTGLIQISAPINPGNSGGALVNLRAELIGIPTLSAADPTTGNAANGIGFAIPSNRVKFITHQLITSGHVTNTGQGFLGISGVSVTPDIAAAYNLPVDHGVLITAFANDATGRSPAEQAGLRVGDIIVAVNGTKLTGNGDLAGTLLALAPGTTVKVTFQRGSAQQTVEVTVSERPAQ